METKYLTTADEDIRTAADIIRRGGLVAFPTETVYGLGGNALNASASKAIYEAKGRPSDNPLIVHIAHAEEAGSLTDAFFGSAKTLARAIWPGPMTLVLPKLGCVPYETTGGLDTVAIRCPANEAARRLIEYSGVPIAAPSANSSGRPSPTVWQHVRDDLDGRIDAVIMGESCIGGIESTIVDMTGELPMILRPGLISPERVSEITGLPCGYDDALSDPSLAPMAPGMKYKHYAPKADMILYAGKPEAVRAAIEKDAEKLSAEGKKVAVLIYEDARTAAQRLFADLRCADREGAEIILASAFPEDTAINYSVMNRMLKSAGYNIKEV